MNLIDIINNKIKELRVKEQTYIKVKNASMFNIVCAEINVLMDVVEEYEQNMEYTVTQLYDKLTEELSPGQVSKHLEIVEILEKEDHCGHNIVIHDGKYYWKENEEVRKLVDEKISVNDLIQLLIRSGYDKNSEVYRKLYRDMGYSLSGYWEVFYWEVNNPEAHKYTGNGIEV